MEGEVVWGGYGYCGGGCCLIVWALVPVLVSGLFFVSVWVFGSCCGFRSIWSGHVMDRLKYRYRYRYISRAGLEVAIHAYIWN